MENNKPYTALGAKIRERRESLGMLIKQVSLEIAKDRSYLSKIENGQIKPTLDVLDKLIKCLSLDLPEALELYKLAGYSNDKIKFEGKEAVGTVNSADAKKLTSMEKEPVQIFVPDNVNIFYTDSVFITSSQFGVVCDIAQKLAGTNQHRVVARFGLSFSHARALKDSLEKHLQDKEVKE